MQIGRVFATSFAMLRQRFWKLAGMWAVFFAIQIAGSIALGVGIVMMSLSGMESLEGLEDTTAIAGMGIGMLAMVVLFYGAYLVLVLAQQAAMVTLASPLEEPAFGPAMARGFRSALPFFVVAVLATAAYVALAVAVETATGGSESGESSAAGTVIGLVLLPVAIYLACRFSVLVPVVAVDQVYNPLAALRRSWVLTRGKVLSILLAMIALTALMAVGLGLPFVLVFSALPDGGQGAVASEGVVLLGVLLIVLLFILVTIFAAAFNAALHSEVTGGGAEALEEVFA
ncbi:glycerophosphoryl diester phosphodiesterase membrane domain-containing protein [Porphyrobacter sp. CACIAM 03H1]|uniref:glycerophosphoryl diester phosphodiesterase membrane domain-containing protein n=1 Tax=Porphyrobacter sp. CACIAM 03H1 TaxID=2003315 RepID=UPI000B5A5E50|nr:glycerophosphoryl diester phosphodiesterase membrane domain-containing protein [Porphyrobacter sp. CACIAM 03H1]ASJ91860.1 hypothetical protein CBR61_13635 [Porphyrobacter sp. CACIAM 03H1]